MRCSLKSMRRAVAWAIVCGGLLVVCACDGDHGVIQDSWPHLFDTDYGLVNNVTPQVITPNAPTQIHVSARALYSGTGGFTLEGGDDYGDITSPVTAPLGRSNWRVNFVAGQPVGMTWTVQFTAGPDPMLIGAVAWMDSLDIDGTRYWIGAPEAIYHLGAEFGSELYRRLSIPRQVGVE